VAISSEAMTAQRNVCLVDLYFIALRGRRLRCFRAEALRREVVFVDFFLVTFYGCSIYFYRMTADLTLLKTELDIFWQHHFQ
jgi:hypothetical protein